MEIPLYDRSGLVKAVAQVDAADYEDLGCFRWFLLKGGYAIRKEARKTIRMHRAILGLQPGEHADHINGDGLDNRRFNLRRATHAQNMQNRRSNRGSSSRYRGVSRNSRKTCWQAKLKMDGRTIHLGNYKDETEAARAASRARQRLMPFAVER